MCDGKDATFSLKVMINKERSKVVFVEADADFVDVLLSFLTIPLGKLVKVLEKHYGDEAPVIGSFNTLYNGLANLDTCYFLSEGGKQTLLNPKSSLGDQCIQLKLDVTDTHPAPEYFGSSCGHYSSRFCFINMHNDPPICKVCYTQLRKLGEGESQSLRSGGYGVFTKKSAAFIISDDLHILPVEAELNQIISILGITDTNGADIMNVSFGFNEIMDLLKSSFISPTPLSDLILDHKRQISHPAKMKPELPVSILSSQIETDAETNPKKLTLKVILQKSTNKLLYARAGQDFVNFLCGFLAIPFGKVVFLLGSNNCLNNINRSIDDLIDDKFFSSPDMKNRLIELNLAHGSVSKNQILPLPEQHYEDILLFDVSSYFPEGSGNYVKGLRSYVVADNLTVSPYCFSSIITMLNGLNIPVSDITELELVIGVQEALRILKASLTSTCVLTDALVNDFMLKKQPKQEP